MKQTLLAIIILFVAIAANAQQSAADSLLAELKKHAGEDAATLNLLNKIAAEYSTINPDKGIEVSGMAITLAQKLKVDSSLALACKNKGESYHSKGENILALKWYNKALNLYKKLDLKKQQGRLYRSIGVVHFDMSDYTKAMHIQEEALKLAQQTNDSAGMARAYISMGIVYQYLSKYPEALKHQQTALKLVTALHDSTGIADVFTNMGLVYLHQGNFQKSLEYYKMAFELASRTNNQRSMANIAGNMATAYDNMEDSANTIKYYTQGLTISKGINYTYGIASNTCNIGIAHYYYGNYLLAINYLQDAFVLFKKLNDKINQSVVMNVLGNIYAEAPDKVLIQAGLTPSGKYKKAIKYNEEALRIAKEVNAPRKQVFALQSLSNIYEMQHDYKKAFDYFKQAEALDDSIVNNSITQKITRLEMQYEFSKTQDSIKAVHDKERAVANAEIQKQRIVKNSMMAGTGLLMLCGLGGFVVYKRNRDIKIKKNEAELNAKVTDVEMKALRAQMNPHFIFNSLNSIADYIDKNQTQTASDFTAKFARLMRMVLENSEYKQITLADDLKALELYMQLESFRLQNKFSYTIHVDENIDQENTLVPPLILQPFVENSIWHGIAKKDGLGNIKIIIKQEGQNINCIVEDDGVGLTDELASKEKTSLGVRITKARIDIINKLKNTNATMRIINKEKGVRAEVELPLVLGF